MFYLTKIDKTLTKKLKNIIISCNENKIEAHTHIRKMGNVFLNAQQVLAQLITHIVLSIPLYHASKTFKFINTSPLQEHAFVLKNVTSLKTFPLDSIDIMCASIVDKYIKRPNYLPNISFIEFVANYDIPNLREKGKNLMYFIMCILMNIETQKITIENNNNNFFLSLIMSIISKVTIPHGICHITCMKYKSIYYIYIIFIIIMHTQQIGKT
jgi:hypothetical protein